MGESAGAGSIMHHIVAPSNYDTSSLFTQAIIQSPAFQPIVNSQETETICRHTQVPIIVNEQDYCHTSIAKIPPV
jgi:carboxylesterase type B